MNNIKTLSIVVPNKKCVNRCPFCVSKLHTTKYENRIETDETAEDDYLCRLQYARDIGIETITLTGLSEPLQNLKFIRRFTKLNELVTPTPFPWIELQSTGYGVAGYAEELWYSGVKTVSLSVSDLFDDNKNRQIIGNGHLPNLWKTCEAIKKYNLNLRISLMLFKGSVLDIDKVYDRLNELGVDQVTFKYLYMNDESSEINAWIAENRLPYGLVLNLLDEIETEGDFLYKLPFGMSVYNYRGIGTLVDTDCMDKHYEGIRYLVLRENCKLYSSWDSKASLIF